jgi:hypothetical protein
MAQFGLCAILGSRVAWRLIVPLLCLIASPASAVEASCVHPDADKLLEQSRAAIHFDGNYFPDPNAKFLPFDADGQRLQWMGTSWDGPPDGALFVLDCAGSRLAALRLGYVQELRAGPTISGIGQMFEVIYTLGSGTGEREESVSLVAFDKSSISVLWSHEASESASAPSLGIEYSDRFSWRFDDKGTRVEITGERKVGKFNDAEHGWAPNTIHTLPSEAFCWNTAENVYAVCK